MLPFGKYTATMEQAPQGYVHDDGILVHDIANPSRNEIEPLVTFEPFDVKLQPVRGDVTFRKTDGNGNPLSGIPFLLTGMLHDSDTPGESHIIVTDNQGDFSSCSQRIAHGFATNHNDEALTGDINGIYELDEEKLDSETGVWFSKDQSGTSAIPIESRGALPFGSYVLKELPCSANEGLNLATVQFSVFKDDYTVKLDNIVDTKPAIFCQARDATDSDRLIRPTADALIIESIQYRNLIAGKRYQLHCSAFVKSTGEKACDSEGNPVNSTTELIPQDPNGTTKVTIGLDCSKLAGEQIEIQTRLTSDDGMTVVPDEESASTQTIDVEPIVEATAQDADDLDKYIMGANARVLECLTYEGLVPGKNYTATCTLNDRATGNALRDSQGQIIAISEEFTPKSSKGHVDMTLPVDTTALAGHDIVAFDKLVDGEGKTIANHEDIEDTEQTVKTVKLTSNAVDKSDGDKLFDANSNEVTIVDTVNYANLIPGEQYKIKGLLMDKETGTALSVNGNPVTTEANFVPREVSGSTDVEYTFDAGAQSSQVLVAFETVENDGRVIAEHTDLDDVAQTVTSEQVDPDTLVGANGENGSAASSYISPLTGDQATRAILSLLCTICGISVCIAYAARRRRKTLESITKSHEVRR